MDLMKMMMGSSIMKNMFGEVLDNIEAAISSRLFYTIDVSNDHWDIHAGELRRFFRNLPDDTEEISDQVFHRETNEPSINMPIVNGDKYVDSCMFHGTPIILVYSMEKKDRGGNNIIFKLMTIRNDRNIKNLRYLIKYIFQKRRTETLLRKKPYITEVDTHSWNLEGYMLRNERSFEDVFIPNSQKNELISSITAFIKKRQWYIDHKIPYHFGILLHGPAGTGKSSIVQAIMSKWKLHSMYIPSGDLGCAFSESGRWRHAVHSFRYDMPTLIVSEDIDTDAFTYKRETEDDGGNKTREEVNTLGKVLNFMDGINSLDNVIYVFSTNHIDKLDPALIRPGRIDLVLEIDYVNSETLDKFLMFHYGKHLPKDRLPKERLTFASIQTLVMKGMVFEEVLKETTYVF